MIYFVVREVSLYAPSFYANLVLCGLDWTVTYELFLVARSGHSVGVSQSENFCFGSTACIWQLNRTNSNMSSG